MVAVPCNRASQPCCEAESCSAELQEEMADEDEGLYPAFKTSAVGS